jgi:Asp/Glu/hydantoin racemase
MTAPSPLRILVINPNTSTSITDSFKPVLSALNLPNISMSYWTCPTGPSIIKSQTELYESTRHCIPPLLDLIDEYDGFLAACYADHPLPRLLQTYVGDKPVVCIFDASITAALALVSPGSKFGILTTGEPFETLLADGVKNFLHSQTREIADLEAHFGGVVASGIGPGDLGADNAVEAKAKILAATRRLVHARDVDVLCMGGVILAGMESWVHEACETELGCEKGRQVRVIDQLHAGIWSLDARLRHRQWKDYELVLA